MTFSIVSCHLSSRWQQSTWMVASMVGKLQIWKLLWGLCARFVISSLDDAARRGRENVENEWSAWQEATPPSRSFAWSEFSRRSFSEQREDAPIPVESISYRAPGTGLSSNYSLQTYEGILGLAGFVSCIFCFAKNQCLDMFWHVFYTQVKAVNRTSWSIETKWTKTRLVLSSYP